jgi:hypothetical protein
MVVGLLLTRIVLGAIAGALAGYIGGAIGAGVEGYYSFLARVLTPPGRLTVARAVAGNGIGMGVIVGFICGGATGAIGGLAEPFLLLLAAGAVFGVASVLLNLTVIVPSGEPIQGFVGSAIGGAVLGAAGGYVGKYVATAIWNLL